jgi:TRAP-type C4-dicarboxylate transport system permease small subunit
MERLHRIAISISRIGALIGGGLLLLSAVVVGIDVVLRTFFSRSIGGSDELSGYALAIATAWGLSFALLDRAHIRVASLYEVVPLRVRAILDLISLAGFLAFMSLTAKYAWTSLAQSMSSNARSLSAISTPLAIPQAVWFAGFVFLLLVIVLLLIESGAAFLRGDLRGVVRLIGAKGVDEELDEEKTVRGNPASGAQI